ncbi:MAG: hypothetical protein WCP55_09465, partial [Lentisphaerota bacterium]
MKTMTSKERLETVIRGGIPDRVPATIHQWQGYHYRNIMKTADDLEAFLAVGLDAVIYPWSCVKPCESPDWISSHTEKIVDDEMTEIEGRIITPDGVLTGKSMRTAYTSSVTE